MTSRHPIAIALATSAFYAGVFVTTAHAEMHYVRVTLVTGQQLTITVDVPPGTPVDQIQIPGLPAPIASIVDLGSVESTPSPTATAPPTVTVDRRRPAPRRRAPARRQSAATATAPTPARRATNVDEDQDRARSRRSTRRPTRSPASANTESLTGKVPQADADAGARRARRSRPRRTDPTFSLAEPGAAKLGVPNFFIDKFKIPPFLLPIYQAAGTEYGIRWEVLAAINEIETNYGRNLNVSSRGRAGLDAVHARHVGGLRRRRQQGRAGRPVQPRRRDLRRRALPEGGGRRQGHPRARSSPTTTPTGTWTRCCCARRSSAACRRTSSAR